MHMYEFDIAITFKHQSFRIWGGRGGGGGGGGGGGVSNPLHAMKHKR